LIIFGPKDVFVHVVGYSCVCNLFKECTFNLLGGGGAFNMDYGLDEYILFHGCEGGLERSSILLFYYMEPKYK
jgi:hypothetical protein